MQFIVVILGAIMV